MYISPNIISFDEAIADSEQYSKRHLLLGNGFSIGCRTDIFHYASLYGEADFSKIPEAKQVFKTLQTQDFEVAIRALESSSKVFPIYAPNDTASASKMDQHAMDLKDLLVSTIAENHPLYPSVISDTEFSACRKFLGHFLAPDRGDGYVFTLNYDLLLYWALMHDDNPLDKDVVKFEKNDSFGNDEDDPEADYVVWQGETAANTANVLFLHGALHLFDSGPELQKYTWIRKRQPLVDQAREAIEANKFPLFVAEGTSVQKKEKIRHNAYLYQCLKVLTKKALTRSHCFFIFGHSLAENDDHIFKRLGKGYFKKLYVGIFGDAGTPENIKVIERAKKIASLRNKHPLEVAFFDSSTANVWGND